MKNLLKLTTLSFVTASVIYAGGYKIPETSTNAIALSAANVAHGHGADAAYYNPANMIFMDDENTLEADLIYIGLDPVNFKGSGAQSGEDIDAKSESFLIPSVNYVSSKLGNARVGLSIVVPGGLSKRWSDSPAVDKAKEFTLEVVEINPTAAFEVTKNFAVAVGLRAVYSSGIVKSSSVASRDMTGDSVDVGYNLAMAYKPAKALEFGVTYRSNIDLHEEGNAKLSIGNAKVYDGGSSVTVPLPATLDVAGAYTFETGTTVEVVYEKIYWSAYKTLDFNYVSPIPPILVPSFDDPVIKEWKDSEAYRLGITQELDGMTLMAGMVYDKSPVPDKSLSYELPDSNSLSVSLGGRYDVNTKLNIGIAALYSMRENRDVKNDDIEGRFSNANVLIISAGLGYKF
jgi:long-chain fatty acid transport protein